MRIRHRTIAASRDGEKWPLAERPGRRARPWVLVAAVAGLVLTSLAPGPATAITRRWTGAVSFAWSMPAGSTSSRDASLQ